MVSVRSGDDGAEHDGLKCVSTKDLKLSKPSYLVWLVLEVSVPELVELRSHLLKLLLGRTNLEAGVDRVGGEASLLRADLPLLEEL